MHNIPDDCNTGYEPWNQINLVQCNDCKSIFDSSDLNDQNLCGECAVQTFDTTIMINEVEVPVFATIDTTDNTILSLQIDGCSFTPRTKELIEEIVNQCLLTL